MNELSLQLWYEALGTDYGLVLSVSDVDKARQRLYALRTKAGDRDLDCISVVVSPTDPSQLWLVKRKPNGSS